MRCSRRNNGNLVKMAHELSIHRRWLYRLIYRWDLWAEIDAHRASPIKHTEETENWLQRTREVLGGKS